MMRVAQRVQYAFQGVMRFPMIVDDNAEDVFHQAALQGTIIMSARWSMRCTAIASRMPPIRNHGFHPCVLLAPPPVVAHGGGGKLWNRAAQLRLMPAMVAVTRCARQIGHQHRQALLGQKLKVQQVNHDSRDVGAVLHWRGHASGKHRARPCCTEMVGSTDPRNILIAYPSPDVVRAPEPQHRVHGSGGDGKLGRLRLISPRSCCVPITRLYRPIAASTFARTL